MQQPKNYSKISREENYHPGEVKKKAYLQQRLDNLEKEITILITILLRGMVAMTTVGLYCILRYSEAINNILNIMTTTSKVLLFGMVLLGVFVYVMTIAILLYQKSFYKTLDDLQ